MKCPYCNTDNREDRDQCYHCGKDIGMLRLLVNKSRYHYNVALEHAERSRYPEAAAELINALDLDASFAQARVVLGTVYARMNDMERARESWKSLIESDDSMNKAWTYLGKLDIVEAERPARRWLRIFASVSAGMAVIALITAGFLFRPTPGLKPLADGLEYLARDNYDESAKLASELNRRRGVLPPNIVKASDMLLTVINTRIGSTLQMVDREIAGNNLAGAQFYLSQAEEMRWPEETKKDLSFRASQLREALQATINRETQAALQAGDPAAFRKAQREIAKLADLRSDSNEQGDIELRQLALAEIDYLDDMSAQLAEEQRLRNERQEGIPLPVMISYKTALSAGRADEAISLARALVNAPGLAPEKQRALQSMLADVIRANSFELAPVERVALAKELGISPVDLVGRGSAEAPTDPVLVAWFRASVAQLTADNVPAPVRKLAALNLADVSSQAPTHPETAMCGALAMAAQGSWDGARAEALRLRNDFPAYPRPEGFDAAFGL